MLNQFYGFTRTAVKIYNSTSPVQTVQIATVSIINDCVPLSVKYPVKYSILLAQVRVTISSNGNPWAVAIAIGSACQIID